MSQVYFDGYEYSLFNTAREKPGEREINEKDTILDLQATCKDALRLTASPR